MSDSSYKKRAKVLLGQDNNTLVLLFAANTILFVALHIISSIYQLSNIDMGLFNSQVLNHLTLPAAPDTLVGRPWTILLHLFTHYRFWHLFSNMLWLWFFGYLLQDMVGTNKLLPIYLYGGFAGAVFFLLASNIIPGIDTASTITGAGAAVMAVAVAITILTPDFRLFPMIYGGIPLWVITILFVAIDISTLGRGNMAVVISHIAAGGMGFLYAKQLTRGNDMGAWMSRFWGWLNDLFNPEMRYRKEKKEKLHYEASRKPFEKNANQSQQKLDAILDKIHADGYDSLSAHEKEFLEQSVKQDS